MSKVQNQEEAALGRSRGGFSTKIHALGNPLKFILQPNHFKTVMLYTFQTSKTYAMFGSKYRKDGERSCCCI